MRGKGIHYDTGTSPSSQNSRPEFDPGVVEREMQIIVEDLHCTAIRITGGDLDRIDIAAGCAAAVGLEIWYSPFPCDMTNQQMLPYFADSARRAERLRRSGVEVVLATGCELSLFARGYLPGDAFTDRLPILAGPGRAAALRDVPARVNDFLGEVVTTVRPLFAGPITYAASPLDGVDWSPFDIVGIDLYRNLHNAASYRDDLRKEFVHGKPVAVMEVGCCAFRGAGDYGGAGWYVALEPGSDTVNADLVRDEDEQVIYLNDLMPLFDNEGVDSVFWFSFAGYSTPHRHAVGRDLDLASYGIVKILDHNSGPTTADRTYPEMPWEPKKVFHTLAERYRTAPTADRNSR